MDPYLARQTMVEKQIKARGITNPRVLKAFLEVPRHLFVDEHLKYRAYDDCPLPIGYGQTISQPYIVALMTDALQTQPDHKVLEIGTGSGYQSAILSKLCADVYSVERISPLASRTRMILDELGYFNVHIIIGDGTKGLDREAFYDGILVTAGAPYVPEKLVEQLKTVGRLVIPVGDQDIQDLKCITKTEDGITEKSLGGCRFVKLIGEEGWEE
ncbi:MAG: protein-L-isoaspartate(D-aspartate) O-methyltransferase [Deltaproteobacteria bacterium]|nr:protein-L-isoaspartate(D-aspartate) O-methyltransferase [Deltaproteobacteria bacterium]